MSRTLSVDELLTKILEHKHHPLAPRFTQWLTTSKRFRTFAETYQTKIRSKVRTSQDQERLNDVAFELETAYRLLQEPRLTVAYEPHEHGHTRRPDFAVTFTTKFTLSVEVTRMRSEPAADPERESTKLQHVIANKLVQMLPSTINLLVIGAADELARRMDIDAAMAQMKKRAEAKETQLFSRSGSRDTSEFFRQYYRLSAILVCSEQSHTTDTHSILWINKEAKHPLPITLQTILKSKHDRPE